MIENFITWALYQTKPFYPIYVKGFYNKAFLANIVTFATVVFHPLNDDGAIWSQILNWDDQFDKESSEDEMLLFKLQMKKMKIFALVII